MSHNNGKRRRRPETPATVGPMPPTTAEQADPHAGFIKYGLLLTPKAHDALQRGTKHHRVSEQQFINEAVRLYEVIREHMTRGYTPAMADPDGTVRKLELTT